jgi:hypothetical protein
MGRPNVMLVGSKYPIHLALALLYMAAEKYAAEPADHFLVRHVG